MHLFNIVQYFFFHFYLKYVIICFRSAAVDSTGREFNRNRLIALISAIVLEEVRTPSFLCLKRCFFCLVVGFSICFALFISLASRNNYCYRQCDFRWPDYIYWKETWYMKTELPHSLFLVLEFVYNLQSLIGGKHHRFKRGYKNVIDEAIRLVSLTSKISEFSKFWDNCMVKKAYNMMFIPWAWPLCNELEVEYWTGNNKEVDVLFSWNVFLCS